MLVRRYIAKRLQEYYAQPASSVVGSISSSSSSNNSSSSSSSSHNHQAVPFQWLLGEFHWKRRFSQLYKEQNGQWLTPTEVFKPYYSNVIARYVANVCCTTTNHHQPPPLSIIELGGGRGTNALCMMDFLEQNFPHLYEHTNYTIVDASPTLIQLQQENLCTSRHAPKVQFVEKDLVQVGEGKSNLINFDRTSDPKTQYVILGLELLDNLPHCKIRVRNTKVEQAELVLVGDDDYDDAHDSGVVDKYSGGRPIYNEVFAPLSDPLLKEILHLAPIYKRIRGAAWIPSIACGLLQSISRQPQLQNNNCHILLADFDWLPPSDTALPEFALSFPAEGQPLVTDMKDVDHACYLLPTDTPTDILFPTNFDKLATFAKKVFASSSQVMVQKQADFLRTHGIAEVQATSGWLTGYSPLIHDYRNCSVLLISTRRDDSSND